MEPQLGVARKEPILRTCRSEVAGGLAGPVGPTGVSVQPALCGEGGRGVRGRGELLAIRRRPNQL